MGIPNLEYIQPRTIEETCDLLQQYKGRARILAGGTDLLNRLKKRDVTPDILIDLRGIPDLDQIALNENQSVTIGALIPIQASRWNPKWI